MQLEEERQAYSEITNDPVILLALSHCVQCKKVLEAGSVAFPIQNYLGQYSTYICPLCHPRGERLLVSIWRLPTEQYEFNRG